MGLSGHKGDLYITFFSCFLEASIPSVRITENGKVVANQGSSKTITCSLKVQKGKVVKAFNITWATGKRFLTLQEFQRIVGKTTRERTWIFTMLV